MKRLFAIAALLLAGSAAHAGESYSFEVGGRTIHIEAPRDCDSPSCISISIPGIYESGPKRAKRARTDQQAKTDPQAKADPQAKVDPQVKTEPQAVVVPTPAPPKAEPANTTPPASTSTTASLAASDPAAAVSPRAGEPAQPRQTPAAPAPAVVATAPVSAPIQNQQAPTAPAASKPASSPLGIWQTEEKQGLVRIEACGINLCGYSVDARTNQNGEKILINMKTVSDTKWSGRIHDPKSGSNYDSTIALKGPDTLRVQGCAFGGMFCGGQTWNRMN